MIRFVALALSIPLATSVAQSLPSAAGENAAPRTLTLRIDNDAFDFWRFPYNRPDEEYSSGVKISYDGGDAAAWAHHLFGGRSACTYGAQNCRTSRWELGQDIYTAERTPDDPKPPAGSRPSAGWLYLTNGAQRLDPDRFDELSITLGVTGQPSLGEFMQKFVHSIAPAYNRPVDWSNQVGFEPGVIVRYEQRRRAMLVDGTAFGWDFIPRFGASVGNVSTEGDVGFQTRLGWALPHPWLKRFFYAVQPIIPRRRVGSTPSRATFFSTATRSRTGRTSATNPSSRRANLGQNSASDG